MAKSKEQFLAMKPGRELNIRVAEDVMGHEVMSDEIFGDVEKYVDDDGSSIYGLLQPYSEDISAAQLVVQRMIKLGHGDAISWEHYGNGRYTHAEAICKMALLVILEKEPELGDKIKEEIEEILKNQRGWLDDG